MAAETIHTADLSDELGDSARIAIPGYRGFGAIRCFAGPVRTLRCFEDNSKVRATLETAGNGAVLIVDGGASMNCALLGDMLAQLAIDNGWAGIIVNGCIRDSAIINGLPIGVKALATHPRKSKKRGLGEVDVMLEFSCVQVQPGDYVVADEDGWLLSPAQSQPSVK